jgi:hypothetical protein
MTIYPLRYLIGFSLSLFLLSLVGLMAQAGPVLSVAGTAGPTYPGGETTYQVELLNHTDQIVYDGVISLTLPAGFSYVPGSTLALGEGWPLENREPVISGQTLTWGPYHLPAAGVKEHNPYGIHTLMNDCQAGPALHLEAAKQLVGSGGYVTQLFYGIDTNTTGPSDCAVSFVSEAYARNLIPILRLQGHAVNGIWQAPSPGSSGDYAEIAEAFARYVAGLPRRNTNPLYIAVWNEPDLWIEWSNRPNARQYARFFVAVSKAIKRLGDGRIRVVNGALTPGNTRFLDQMLAVPGFKNAFDVWASHCYPYNHPPSYNNHARTARYGTYAIDCYLRETARIKSQGRSGFKVMVTETGYELGNKTFDFEGFARINETNRAAYISSAFANYWQHWPEIVAVTPFQLADTSGHWAKFDWLYPTSPYTRHLQFERVAALPKPGGEITPYGFQITFQAKVGTNVEPGTYFSQLSGQDRDGHTAFDAHAVPVEVAAAPFPVTYLPIIFGPIRRDGPWYFSTPETASPGAIVPDVLLEPANEVQSVTPLTAPPAAIPLAGEPQAIVLEQSTGLGGVALAGGSLEIVNLTSWETTQTLELGGDLQRLSSGPPGSVFVSLSDGLAQIDLPVGQVVKQLTGLGRLRGLAWDAATSRLFVADATHDQLLVFSDNLNRQQTRPLHCQPDQLIFDEPAHQLYITCPADLLVMTFQADSLTPTAQAALTGGPILDLVLDAPRQRLYALSLLAPGHQGITIWQTPTLQQVALLAGSSDFPLQTASALALTPAGQLLIAEPGGVWQMDPADYRVSRTPVAGDTLAVQPDNGTIYALDSAARLLRVYP